MPTWSYDGFPVCRFDYGGDGSGDQLRTCPGYGPDLKYEPGTRFWDDTLDDDISWQHAMQRAPVVNVESYQGQYGGPLPATVVSDFITDVGSSVDDYWKDRPPQVPNPKGGQGWVPDPGDVLVLQTHNWSPPPVAKPTQGGGAILPPSEAPSVVPDREGTNAIIEQLNGLTAGLQSLLGSVPQDLAGRLDQLGRQAQTLSSNLQTVIVGKLSDLSRQIASIQPGQQIDPHAIIDPVLAAIRNLQTGLTPDQAHELSGIYTVVGQIEDTLSGISGSLDSKLSSTADRIEGRLSKVVDDVAEQLGAAVANVAGSVQAVESHILTQLGNDTTAIEQTVQQSAATITAQIGAQIDTLGTTIGDDFKVGSQLVSGAIDQLGADLANLKFDPAGFFNALFSFGSNSWHTWATPVFALVEHATRGTLDSLEADATEMVDQVLGQVAADPATPAPIAALLGQLTDQSHAAGFFTKMAFLLVLVHEAVTNVFRPALEKWGQVINQNTTVELPSNAVAAAARARGLLAVEEARQLAAQHGLAARWADLEGELDRELLSPAEVIAAWLRGYLTEDAAVAQLVRRGFNEADGRTLMKLATQVPTPGDLVTFMRREVFTPQISEPYGHFDEYPAGATPWFAKVGFDEQVAKLYWAAHWDVPSATQFFEMFQRGIINEDELRLGLRAANIVPGWRDRLIQLTYHPITRVDLRRFYQLGTITADELPRRYRDLGYSPENADLAAKWTVQYAEHAKRTEEATFRNPTRQRVLTAHLDGTLTTAEATDALVRLGYAQADVDHFLGEAALLQLATERGKVRDGLRKLYTAGYLDEPTARGRLAAAGFDGAVVDRLLLEWGPDRELEGDREVRRHHHELTRAEITAAYVDGLLARPNALQELTDAGYSIDAANTLLDLQDAKTERDLTRGDVEAIHTQYTHGAIDRATASASLDGLHIPPRSKMAYLRRWDAEKLRPPPRLSNAELKGLYVAGQMSQADVRAQLVADHLSGQDADHLLQLWEVNRQHTIENLTDAELKKLLGAQLITDDEIRRVLQLRGLAPDVATRLAKVVGA